MQCAYQNGRADFALDDAALVLEGSAEIKAFQGETLARAPSKPMPYSPVSDEQLALPEEVRTRKKGIRPLIHTVAEAVRLIDRDLPKDLQVLPRWTFARALLMEAKRAKKKRDLVCSVRQLKQALSNEGWLDADTSAAPEGQPNKSR